MATEYNGLIPPGWDSGSNIIERDEYKRCYIQVKVTVLYVPPAGEAGNYCSIVFDPPGVINGNKYMPVLLALNGDPHDPLSILHSEWKFITPYKEERFNQLLQDYLATSKDLHPILFRDPSIAGGAPYLGQKAFNVLSTYTDFEKLKDYSDNETYEGLLVAYIQDTQTIGVKNFPAVQSVTFDAGGTLDVNIEKVNGVDVGDNLPIDYKATNGAAVVNNLVPINIARCSNNPVDANNPIPINIEKFNYADLSALPVSVSNFPDPVTTVSVDNFPESSAVEFPETMNVNIAEVGSNIINNDLPISLNAILGSQVGNTFPGVLPIQIKRLGNNVAELSSGLPVVVNNFPESQVVELPDTLDVNLTKVRGVDLAASGTPNGTIPIDIRSLNGNPAYDALKVDVSQIGGVTHAATTGLKVKIKNFAEMPQSDFPDTISVDNFPEPVTTVSVDNFPEITHVNLLKIAGSNVHATDVQTGSVPVSVLNQVDVKLKSVGNGGQLGGNVPVSVSNFPDPVTTVSVDNFPDPVTSVEVSNFPDPQNINIVGGTDNDPEEYEHKD